MSFLHQIPYRNFINLGAFQRYQICASIWKPKSLSKVQSGKLDIFIRGFSECEGKTRKKRKKSVLCKKEDDNLTAVQYGIEDIRLEQRKIPRIGPGDVLIGIDCVGICGSDVHYLVHGRIGPFVLKKPMVVGHEASGIVKRVGREVKHLKRGDRVCIEPGQVCRKCEYCKAGCYNLCPCMQFCATPPYDGNLTRFYKHTAEFVYKLPDHVTMEEGALMEPLSVGVAACRRGQVGLGSDVLIMGAGPIGLVTLLVAKNKGVSNICVTDLKYDRLELAKQMGATQTLLIDKCEDVQTIVKKITKKMCCMPDRSIDCVGSEKTTRLGIYATRAGGICTVVGMADGDVKLPLIHALSREVDIRGVFRYCNDYPKALSLMASGKVKQIKKLVTHHFSIQQTKVAFLTARCGTDSAIKVMIHVQPRDSNNNEMFDNCV